jgi:DNA primase catalytic subunit
MKSAFKPQLRELVFDIDMTDCESGTRVFRAAY